MSSPSPSSECGGAAIAKAGRTRAQPRVVRASGGVDDIDLAAASGRGIAVIIVPDHGVGEVAATRALPLLLARRRPLRNSLRCA